MVHTILSRPVKETFRTCTGCQKRMPLTETNFRYTSKRTQRFDKRCRGCKRQQSGRKKQPAAVAKITSLEVPQRYKDAWSNVEVCLPTLKAGSEEGVHWTPLTWYCMTTNKDCASCRIQHAKLETMQTCFVPQYVQTLLDRQKPLRKELLRGLL